MIMERLRKDAGFRTTVITLTTVASGTKGILDSLADFQRSSYVSRKITAGRCSVTLFIPVTQIEWQNTAERTLVEETMEKEDITKTIIIMNDMGTKEEEEGTEAKVHCPNHSRHKEKWEEKRRNIRAWLFLTRRNNYSHRKRTIRPRR